MIASSAAHARKPALLRLSLRARQSSRLIRISASTAVLAKAAAPQAQSRPLKLLRFYIEGCGDAAAVLIL